MPAFAEAVRRSMPIMAPQAMATPMRVIISNSTSGCMFGRLRSCEIGGVARAGRGGLCGWMRVAVAAATAMAAARRSGGLGGLRRRGVGGC